MIYSCSTACSVTNEAFDIFQPPTLDTLTSYTYGITLLAYIHDSAIAINTPTYHYFWIRASPGYKGKANRSGILSILGWDIVSRMRYKVNEVRHIADEMVAYYSQQVRLKLITQCTTLFDVAMRFSAC